MESQDQKRGGERDGGVADDRQGRQPGLLHRAGRHAGTDYYAAGAGAEKPGREPEGIWTGDGCRDLGLEPGAFVDHEAFADDLRQPRRPAGRLAGSAGPLSHRDAEAIYARLLNAEPGATAERREELFAQAQAKAEKSRSVAFFDATFSVSKVNYPAARLGARHETRSGGGRRH